MRKQDHYINCIDREYILNMEYDEKADQFTMSIKWIAGKEFKRIDLPNIVIQSIVAIYQQLKFEVK